MIGLGEILLLIAAAFATGSLISKDDVYSAFYLGSAILFVALYVLGYISELIGIIIFTVYTASVIGLIFLGYANEEGGLSKYLAISIPLAFAIAVVLAKYLPETSIATIAVNIDALKELIIPIASGLAAIIASAQEVRRNDRDASSYLPDLRRHRYKPLS